MAKVVILGAGVSGHTAASFLKKWVGKKHDVIVVSPNSKYNWIPSNIWVGIGLMTADQVTFPLKPIYERKGVEYKQAKAVSIHPEGDGKTKQGYVTIQYTSPDRLNETERVEFDFLVNATGPKLNFAATEGLGPEGHSLSVCTYGHAEQTAVALHHSISEMKKGKKQKFLIGTGHGQATCQGAAFEYVFNLEFYLRQQGVRELADITWISNEYELGDFGMGGMHIKRGGYVTHSKIFAESLYNERGLNWITRAHVNKVENGKAHYENLDGEYLTADFDFAMLLPPFSGVGLKAYDQKGDDISEKVFHKNGFMFVDANYQAGGFDEWKPEDWPEIYQNPAYPNLFAAGIAFAPPHPISKPMQSPNGTPIFPTPPRTGMPSGIIGKTVAHSIKDMLDGKSDKPEHAASMARMGAACVASAGSSFLNGTAATMTVYPIVPNYDQYPTYGRDLNFTTGEIGLAGHWIKSMLHYMFMYKAQLKPGWTLIPE